jgi:predicted dehydrogenase
MSKVRMAVIGTGSFGRHHVRLLSQMPGVDLVGVCDIDPERATAVANEFGRPIFTSPVALAGHVDAAIVATPTSTHAAIAAELLAAGVDLLIEKPIAATSAEGERLAELAEHYGRILQVGHLERFNPAVQALERAATIPLFFEIHRLSVFTPRSLDIDVVLDLMIHDLDIVLALTREEPEEIRAAGISVLSRNVDIANVRLSFPSGCIANLTASRVSTEKVRKLRLFQPRQYLSLDYQRQDLLSFSVGSPRSADAPPAIGHQALPVERAEPLARELESFADAVRTRGAPRVDARQASRALRVAEAVVARIEEHAQVVTRSLARARD